MIHVPLHRPLADLHSPPRFPCEDTCFSLMNTAENILCAKNLRSLMSSAINKQCAKNLL